MSQRARQRFARPELPWIPDANALTRQIKDDLPPNRWGGVLEAAKAAPRAQARQQPDPAPAASIDSYSTHVAACLAPDTLGL